MKQSKKRNLKRTTKPSMPRSRITMEQKLEGWVINKVRAARDNVDLIELENEFGEIKILHPHWKRVREILTERQLSLENHNQQLPSDGRKITRVRTARKFVHYDNEFRAPKTSRS